jgi:hypothetical protein
MTSGDPSEVRLGRVRGTALAMTLICAAQFVRQLDFSIVNVALPTIQRELSMAAAQLQWIVTGYALTFGSLLLAGGRPAEDRHFQADAGAAKLKASRPGTGRTGSAGPVAGPGPRGRWPGHRR